MPSRSLIRCDARLKPTLAVAGFAAVLLGACSTIQAQPTLVNKEAGLQAETVIFQGRGGSAQLVLQDLQELLVIEVEKLDHECRLSPAQKQKLQLLGQGDIARFFREVESLKLDFENGILRHGTNDSSILFLAQRRLAGDSFFQGRSLLLKSLPGILTAPQVALHEDFAKKIRLRQHEVAAHAVVGLLPHRAHLSGVDRKKFVSLIMTEVPPCPTPGQDEVRYILTQVLDLARKNQATIPVQVRQALIGAARDLWLPEHKPWKPSSNPSPDDEDSEPNRIAPAGKKANK
jgi:hypothetical protein